jgi:hypothetical protein
LRNHSSSWRRIVSFAPLLGLLLLAGAALQDGRDILESPVAIAVLGAVAALGAPVALWTTWQLRAAALTSVASALAGRVTLHGRAQPLPGAQPLVSPEGATCLWFEHRTTGRRAKRWDSARPFLLVDDTGQCMVLPAGAQIDGDSKSHATADSDERRLLAGDRIHVVGHLMPASESIRAQLENSLVVAQSEAPRTRANRGWPFQWLFARRSRVLAPVQSAQPASQDGPIGLPVIAGAGAGGPFIISIDAEHGQDDYYALMAIIDLLVLCGAAGTYLLLRTYP